MPDEMSHLSPDQVAAYAERRLNDADLSSVERHLADCSDCRRDVAHVVRLLRPAQRRWIVRSARLVAAAIIVVVFVRLIPGDASEPAIRDPVRDGNAIDVLGPDSLETVAGGPLRFVWRPVVPGTRYDLTITDQSGSRVFSVGSADTSIALPDSVRLDAERTYLWFVDALRPDGRSVSSGMRFLRIVR